MSLSQNNQGKYGISKSELYRLRKKMVGIRRFDKERSDAEPERMRRQLPHGSEQSHFLRYKKCKTQKEKATADKSKIVRQLLAFCIDCSRFHEIQAKKWSGYGDSNSGPFDPQSNALNQAALYPDHSLIYTHFGFFSSVSGIFFTILLKKNENLQNGDVI